MLNIAFNDNLDRDNEWHFMPITLTSDQPIPNAKVSNYFKSGIK